MQKKKEKHESLVLVACEKCGWVHVQISREQAKKEVKSFNTYFDSLVPSKQLEHYSGKRASIKDYERCSKCGNSYTNFRKVKDDECPSGSTIGPIIARKD